MHKFFFICTVTILFSLKIQAQQCPSISLSTLEQINDLPLEKKDTKILELGFDFLNEQKTNDLGNVRVFGKCFGSISANMKNYYQMMIVFTDYNIISFSTFSKANYLTIRQYIESLGCKYSTSLGSDVFNCKGYRYTLKLGSDGGYTISVGKI